MHLIEWMIRQNKQVIVLIPEISLTYQVILNFYSRFGEQVSMINSRLQMESEVISREGKKWRNFNYGWTALSTVHTIFKSGSYYCR